MRLSVVLPDLLTYNALVGALEDCQSERAAKIISAMTLQSVTLDGISYTALVCAFGKGSQAKMAEETF